MSGEFEGRDSSGGRAPPVVAGDIVAGKYRVDRVLGAGGMGVVVAATHLDLLEPRAIKFMLAAHLDNAEAVARFVREARASARLKGEHIAKVHDVGKLENGAPYMVMEYLTGVDLGSVLQRRGTIPASEAALYILQACEALAEAHAAGIVHRDLKPENIFLAEGPGGVISVKVLDFGISMMPSAGDLRMTQEATIMGSPFYMSPEQTRSSRDVDPRTDVWALGILLYQLVTGRLPFLGETLPEIVTGVLFGHLAPPSSLVRGLPSGFERVILHCLERELDRRCASVAELAERLVPFAPVPSAHAASVEHTRRLLNRSSGPMPDRVSAGDAPTLLESGRSFPPSSSDPRRAPTLGLVAGIALSAMVAATAFLLHGRTATPGPSPADLPPVAAAGATSTQASPPVVTPTGEIAAPAPSSSALPAMSVEAPRAQAATSASALPVGSPRGGSTPLLGGGWHPGAKGAAKPVAAETKSAKPPPSSEDPFGTGRQ